MAVINRTLDSTEQRKVLPFTLAAPVNGATHSVGIVPFPCTIDEAQIAVWGVSGAPTYELSVQRFIAGAGVTRIVLAIGTSNTVAEFGTSGPGAFGASTFGFSGMVLANASGSTLNNLLANDLLYIVTGGGSGAAAKYLSVGVVLKPTQDIKVHFGLF